MIELIKRLMGKSHKVDFKQLKSDNAVIVDVRSPEEYKSGHIIDSINIPLDKIDSQLNRLKKNQVIITCCASGMRSERAKSILQAKGYEVYNGGGWQSLNRKL